MKYLNFISGEISPLTFQEGISIFLAQKNTINLVIKTTILSKNQIEAFCYGNIELGIQVYNKKLLKTKYDGLSFSISIENFIEQRIVNCNFNLATSSFKLEEPLIEDKGYRFNLILINSADNKVIISREIGTGHIFSKNLYDIYLKNKIKDINKEDIFITNYALNKLINSESIRNIIKKFTVSFYKKNV